MSLPFDCDSEGESDSHVCLDKHNWCGPRQINSTGLPHTELIWKADWFWNVWQVQCSWCVSDLNLGYLTPEARLGKGKKMCSSSHTLQSNYNAHLIICTRTHRRRSQGTDVSYLALRYGMWVLFQRQRQEVLFPSLKTWNKKITRA